uniref:N-terminal EF-hand calcium binding protein 3 n=1 Tax=Pundamilia nyererei TaxID=303518 RepID=A0A3B4FLS5_9CICH
MYSAVTAFCDGSGLLLVVCVFSLTCPGAHTLCRKNENFAAFLCSLSSFCTSLLSDDGKLNLEEFQSYFTDGILTDEQMQELYYSIDRQQTDNLDIDKLSEYFTPHLGEYVNVLSALEKLNVAILKAMDKTKEEYQGSSVLGQFVTRFLLRETTTQLQSLQSSLDCAMEAVHDQEHTSGPETNVCEGERRGAVSASSQNLHRCHYHPAKQPAVCPFICLCAVCLRISL